MAPDQAQTFFALADLARQTRDERWQDPGSGEAFYRLARPRAPHLTLMDNDRGTSLLLRRFVSGTAPGPAPDPPVPSPVGAGARAAPGVQRRSTGSSADGRRSPASSPRPALW